MSKCDSSVTLKSWLTVDANRKLRFVVPVYQRLFTWGGPQFDRLLADLTEWSVKQSNEPYYLGIITVVEGKEAGVRLLIDGQQRLTVIALLAGLFGWTNNLKPNDYLDYEARPKDRQALKFIWENGASWLTKERHEVENAVNGIASESMRKFVLHVFDNREKWRKFSDSAKNRLTLLVSCLPQNYSEQIELQNEYFEKMNSAGRQLEPHEVLKVGICSVEDDFKKWNAAEDFTKCYAVGTENDALNNSVAFRDIIDTIHADKVPGVIQRAIAIPVNSDEQKSSIEKWRPALIDFQMFLLHVLMACLNGKKEGNARRNSGLQIPADSHRLLEMFSMHKETDISSFVTMMVEYREFLDKWIIHKSVGDDMEDSDENASRFSYWTCDSQGDPQGKETAYFNGGRSDDSDVRKLKQVQMALFAIGGQSQKWMCDTFLELRDLRTESKNKPKELYSILLGKLIAAAGFNEMTDQKWMRYGEARPAQFVCLDYFLWLLANSESDDAFKSNVFGKNPIPVAITGFIPRANKSVEHFHPQMDNNNSSCHIGLKEDRCQERPGWGADVNVDDTKVSIKDMFGNLALISAGRNSEYSNFSVNEKSARIKKQEANKNLESIKLWIMAKSCDSQDEKWTPTKAQEHAKLMQVVIQWGLQQRNIKTNNDHLSRQ